MAKYDQPEHRLSHWCCELNDKIIIEPFWATAVDTGTYMHGATDAQRFARENHRKFMGIKPHHLDIYVYGCESRVYTQIELKDAKTQEAAVAKLSGGQRTTMRLLGERGIPTGVAWTVLTYYRLLAAAGLKLHGNAENIAQEFEARWRAAQDAADIKKAKPRKKSRSGPSIRRAGVPPTLEEVW